MLDRRRVSPCTPQVALRPEPFGALAYHYGNRRLVFLKHPDIVRVVRDPRRPPDVARRVRRLPGSPSARWPAFERAIAALVESEMLGERALVG